MKLFHPHDFAIQIKFDETKFPMPRIRVSDIAYEKMLLYVDIASKEVGWLGTVSVQPSNIYLIEDVFLLKQQVHGTETEISNEGLQELATELLARPNGEEIWNNIRFWGHSHVNMGTNPSSTDNSQMDIFRSCGHPFFIRGIFNKDGRAQFSLYLYEQGLTFDDARWSRESSIGDALRQSIEEEFRQKVTEKQMGFHQGGHMDNNPYQQYHYGNKEGYSPKNVIGPSDARKSVVGEKRGNVRGTKHGGNHHDILQLPVHYRGVPPIPDDGRTYIWDYSQHKWTEIIEETSEANLTPHDTTKIPDLIKQENEAKKKAIEDQTFENMIKFHQGEYSLTELGGES